MKSEQAYEKMIPNGRNSSNHYFGASQMNKEKGSAGSGCMLIRTIRKRKRLSIHLECMRPSAEKGWRNWRFKRWMKEQESLARKDLLSMCLRTTRQPFISIKRWAMP